MVDGNNFYLFNFIFIKWVYIVPEVNRLFR